MNLLSIYSILLIFRKFLLATLQLAKELRPYGKWGYYGYPYVDNYEKGEANVSKQYMKANDE